MLLALLPLALAADPEAARLVAEARAELRAAQDLVDDARSPAVQREIHRKLDHVATLLAQAEALARADAAPPPPPAPPPPRGPVPCTAEEHARIVAAVKREAFGDGRLAVLRSAAAERFFTAAQVRDLVKVFSFGDEKVEAAVILHARTVDLADWYVVYEAFDFDSDKEKLRKRLGQ
ncbi:MAG: DUF4476 domain-containing protein [Myxococcota bacterium]